MTSVLRLNGVGFRRAGTQILTDVSWEVEQGQRWVVLGHNGAGKTTIMRMLAAREFPSTGSVEVLGERLGAVDVWELRQRIGFASSALTNLIPAHEQVRDVVLTGAYGTTGRWKEESEEIDDARVTDLLRVLGVARLADRAYGTLSSGEKQRVAIARALMPDPELLVLDEPAAGLDLAGREQLLAALTELASYPGAPVMVIVTHHVEEIPRGTTHALILAQGKVHSSGRTEQVLTSENISAAYGTPLLVTHQHGRFAAMAVPTARPARRAKAAN